MRNDTRHNGPLIFAGLTILAATIAVAMAHRPTRKRVRESLIDTIDKTDRKLDQMDEQAREFVSAKGKELRKTQTAAVKDLQRQLQKIQKELDKLQ